jgi:hypothetical protein
MGDPDLSVHHVRDAAPRAASQTRDLWQEIPDHRDL